MSRRVRWTAIALVVPVLPLGAGAESRPLEARFDLYAFSQEDNGGQALRNEGMSYWGARPAGSFQLGESLTLHASGAVAVILNEDAAELPASTGATITSASSRVIAMDISVGLELRRPGSPWTFRPGVYYHHQIGWVAEGIDLGLDRELAGGDAVLSLTLNQRVAFPKLRTWDDRDLGRDITATHSAALGWKQNVSRSVVTQLTLQFTRADGYLGDSYNYIVFYRQGTPSSVGDERLPSSRNRLQLSVRVRWSPWLGTALGWDGSTYLDDWGIHHFAMEPSTALPLPGRARGRFWYRLSDQRGSKYFQSAPRFFEPFQTQDSDLGTFITHGGGLTLAFPWGDEGRWEWRLTAFGLTRSDGIRAGGADGEVVRTW